MQKRHLNREQYFKELAHTCERFIFPFIQQVRPIDASMKVLEIGCGEGGNLLPFVRKGCQVVGCDLSPTRIEEAKTFFKKEDQSLIQLIASDVFLLKEMYGQFDLIIIHDVLEHIEIKDKKNFLLHVRDFLAPNGIIYFGFPAWQMPFGGHQQIINHSIISKLPFIHILPFPVYRSILKLAKVEPHKIKEMMQIKRSRMSIERFYRLMKQGNFDCLQQQLYFINPHYETKFGLKPRKLSCFIALIPWLRNFFTTSCFFIVKPNK